MKYSSIIENIQAFHGTPHEFKEFSLKFINTGEGNQAYGFGVYLAQRYDIANFYAQSTSGDDDDHVSIGGIYLDGKYINARLPEEKLSPLERAALAYWFAKNQTDAIRDVAEMIDFVDNPEVKELYTQTLQVLKTTNLVGKVTPACPLIYEVIIKRNDDEFMEWRLPLSGQSEYVQVALKSLGLSGVPGSEYNRLCKELAAARNIKIKEAKKFVSMKFYKAGIAGCKYKDAASLKMEHANNYVVFNPREVEILKSVRCDTEH